MNITFLPKLVAAAALGVCAALPASAITYTYAANLSGAAEAPPNASTAFGTALVTFDDASLTVSVLTLFAGLSAPATAAHIHGCTSSPGTGTAGVSIGFTGFPAATTASYANTFTLSAASYSTLLTGTSGGNAYVNVHNANFPGGEIRGFLISTPVPEPATYGMMALGLAPVAGLVRRRKLA